MSTQDTTRTASLQLAPATKGKLKPSKPNGQRQMRDFGEVLQKAATASLQAKQAGRLASMLVQGEAAGTGHLQVSAQALPARQAELLMPSALPPRQQAIAEDGIVEAADANSEADETTAREPIAAETAAARPVPSFGSMLAVQQALAAVASEGQGSGAAASRSEVEEQPLSREHAPPRHAMAKALSPVAPEPAAAPEMAQELSLPPKFAAADSVAAAGNVAGAKQEPAAARAETVTVTRIETTLVPAGTITGHSMGASPAAEKAAPLAPAAPALPPVPGQAVVKTIEFRLQPEELGHVKVALHMRGDELRVQVEVTTREAHALLQRDKTALGSVLEKAGFEVAESAVTITLRLDPQQTAPAASGNDASSFQRNGSSSEAFQHPAGGEQSGRAPRHPEREDIHARPAGQKGDMASSPGAGGIYL